MRTNFALDKCNSEKPGTAEQGTQLRKAGNTHYEMITLGNSIYGVVIFHILVSYNVRRAKFVLFQLQCTPRFHIIVTNVKFQTNLFIKFQFLARECFSSHMFCTVPCRVFIGSKSSFDTSSQSFKGQFSGTESMQGHRQEEWSLQRRETSAIWARYASPSVCIVECSINFFVHFRFEFNVL